MRTRVSRLHLLCALLMLLPVFVRGQVATSPDSDGDGLSDSLEDALLQRFRPTLMVSNDDCSIRPARFAPGMATPSVLADDGTVYGQAHPRSATQEGVPQIELHFYHLWRKDCGRLGHALDAEHVAVLLEAEAPAAATDPALWRATYWYAAAHEDTVCDASQVSRASTLEAKTHGATVWISSGKHASFLNEELCHHGCGSDRCTQSTWLADSAVVNLGEANHAMNGATWTHSAQWPLLTKLTRSDFPAERVRRLERLPETDIAWANPAMRPAQAAILGGNFTVDGALTGGTAAGSALATSGHSTDTAIAIAGGKTSSAVGTAARSTGHALRRSLHGVQHALQATTGGTPAEKNGVR